MGQCKMSLKFLHLHLHGLIRSENLELGRDSDTGGQTKYVLELVKSLANTSKVDQVDLVTRQINDTKVDRDYSKKREFVEPGVKILRFKFGPDKYLRKELLWPYLDELKVLSPIIKVVIISQIGFMRIMRMPDMLVSG